MTPAAATAPGPAGGAPRPRRRRWAPGLRAQLILGVTAVHLLLVAAFTADVVARQRTFLTEQSRERAAGLARLLAANASSWVLAQDMAGLAELVGALRGQPDLRYVLVATPRGRVLAHTDPGLVGRHLVDAPSLAVLAGPAEARVVHADAALLDVAAPVLSSTGACVGWVRIGQGQEAIAASLDGVVRKGILYGVLASLAGALLAAAAASRLAAGIRGLLRVLAGVRDGRADLRTGLAGRDEVGVLGAGIDGMLDGVQARERENARLTAELQHAQKLESVGRLAGGVAHDFNNLLTAIVGNAQALEDALPAGPQREAATEILDASRRATEVTRGLLAFSRKELAGRTPLDLRDVVRGTERLVSRLIGEDIEVSFTLPDEPLPVLGDRGQLEQVLMNLATNARDAMPAGGRLSVEAGLAVMEAPEAGPRGLAPGPYVTLAVRDTGTGMDAATRERIFDPFFTTKGVGKGTGLGLAMAYGILRQHQGHIEVESAPGLGSAFTLRLPMAGREAAAAAPRGGPEAGARGRAQPGGRGELILLAEDDDALRAFAARLLQGAGYQVLEAGDGEAAVARFAERRAQIRLCLFDEVMPRRSGRAALEAIRRLAPQVPALFVSGYSPTPHPPAPGVTRLAKPYQPAELLACVRAALDAPAACPARPG